jgi:tryptophan synthase beta chain
MLLGIFVGFLKDADVKRVGVEAGGNGLETGAHAASICGGRVGVLHGCKTYLLQNNDGQILETHSVSAGLDYPGVGPEHSYLADEKLASYVAVNDPEAVEAFDLGTVEGIIPALESAHALAHAIAIAPQYSPEDILLVNLSGRGDKDMDNIRHYRQRTQKTTAQHK